MRQFVFIFVFLSYFLFESSSFAVFQKGWKKCVAGLSSLCTAGLAYDSYRAKNLEILDVSLPEKVSVLNLNQPLNQDSETDSKCLTQSMTQMQLEKDWTLIANPLVFSRRHLIGDSYSETVDAVLFSHFYIFNPTLRKKITRFVLHLTQEENKESQNHKISLVHGTAQGASILLRTVFEQVLADHPSQATQGPKLRDSKIEQELEKYSSVQAYYDEEYSKGPIIKTYYPPSVGAGERTVTNAFDHGPARKHLLSTNLGFFGQSSWVWHGYKESSAEFIAGGCSFFYQACDFLIAAPQILPLLAYEALKSPASLSNPSALIDKVGKGVSDDQIFLDLFRSYRAEDLYSKYRNELAKMQADSGAGLIHLFIPEELALRWCYLSEPFGRKCEFTREDVILLIRSPENHHYLPDTQARVLLHPQLLSNSSLRFYLLGNPKGIQAMVKRMYEIAEEIKATQR